MKITAFLVFAMIISLLSFSASNNIISNDGEYIKFNQVSVEFQGTDTVISVSYSLDMFSSMYIFLLGAHNLEPAIDDLLFDFEGTEMLEIGKDKAVISAKNVSRKNDEFYLHDSHELGRNVNVLTIIYPDGATRTISDASATPDTFYNE